ncbi:Lrp/AsnC family transcriptional regulator [Fimbriimonadia bacterium ATM]|nr:MAG: Lrp/AsnC family transcriptional regulator [Armatimonadota bacterium]MBC6970392.1 Lrp/AsnC family transcriptional regulator [Armatimonadota bacterium]MCE7899797.1 Lrp/AsnC family transcriptional regulator [Armatimonadetes bacterium ATM1]MDL1929069.1 Lrp/AsnC family transcriptional regulator [Fimbriimonadia bacterium ATM]RIJ95863.1 MAG: AsnC family transcriptional regulator [Armatimonadota bacterium]
MIRLGARLRVPGHAAIVPANTKIYLQSDGIRYYILHMHLDTVDLSILATLQSEGRVTNSDLAVRVGLTPAPTLQRVRKLEDAGIIRRYAAILDPESLGLQVTVFVSVVMVSHGREATDRFVAAVSDLPEVLECHHLAGDEDFLLKIVARSPADYERFLLEKLCAIEGVQRVNTKFVLSSPKSTTELPIGTREPARL